MTKENEEITKEDLILLELKNIKENQSKFEESIIKKLDKIENNDLTHINKELKEINNRLTKLENFKENTIPIITFGIGVFGGIVGVLGILIAILK